MTDQHIAAGVRADQQVQGLQGGAGGVGVIQGRQVRPQSLRQPCWQGGRCVALEERTLCRSRGMHVHAGH